MKTLILLGTPKSNLETSSSGFIANALSEGMENKPDIMVIAREEMSALYSAIERYDAVLLITPNYIHSVPAHVLDFLYGLPEGRQTFAVIIQSGFPEEQDSKYIKHYIDSLLPRLGYNYLGCAVIGDAAAYGLCPKMCKSRIPLLSELGNRFEKNRVLDLEYIASSGISAYKTIPDKMVRRLEFMRKIGLGKMVWIILLRSHKAYKRRFDRPYL